jgi:hypothetical protein
MKSERIVSRNAFEFDRNLQNSASVNFRFTMIYVGMSFDAIREFEAETT